MREKKNGAKNPVQFGDNFFDFPLKQVDRVLADYVNIRLDYIVQCFFSPSLKYPDMKMSGHEEHLFNANKIQNYFFVGIPWGDNALEFYSYGKLHLSLGVKKKDLFKDAAADCFLSHPVKDQS